MKESNRQYHEIANIFPLMQGAEFESLKNDIAEHGQREAIWLHTDGCIIDGRNRHRACCALEITPKFVTYEGDAPLAFVISLNLHRRHLDTFQRARVAATLANMTHGGNRKPDQAAILPLDLVSQAEAAEMVNVSERTVRDTKIVLEQGAPELLQAVETGEAFVSTAAHIATLPKAEQVEIVARGKKEILEVAKQIRAEKTKERRAQRKAKNDELCQEIPRLAGLPHKFDLIYADPPWRYEFNPTDSRVVENHYPTMALGDICAMPVGDICIENSVLFMWSTMPKLEEALSVVKAWGFSYRTAIVWNKVKMGQGVYTRQQVELILVCIRGEMYSPENDYTKDFRSLVTIERSNTHSEKPSEFYGIIEGLYPDCTKVELFARNQRAGWSSWGNQLA